MLFTCHVYVGKWTGNNNDKKNNNNKKNKQYCKKKKKHKLYSYFIFICSIFFRIVVTKSRKHGGKMFVEFYPL